MRGWGRYMVVGLVGVAWPVAALAQTSGKATPGMRATSKAQAGRQQPYQGVWASTDAACRDQDGVDRMSIEGNRFFWYETRCTARDIRPAGPQAWTMRMTCEGEGQRFTARPRLTLQPPARLVIDNGPVGREKRQSYVKCTRS